MFFVVEECNAADKWFGSILELSFFKLFQSHLFYFPFPHRHLPVEPLHFPSISMHHLVSQRLTVSPRKKIIQKTRYIDNLETPPGNEIYLEISLVSWKQKGCENSNINSVKNLNLTLETLLWIWKHQPELRNFTFWLGNRRMILEKNATSKLTLIPTGKIYIYTNSNWCFQVESDVSSFRLKISRL